jgi:predicted nuclease with TOPRIM domain
MPYKNCQHILEDGHRCNRTFGVRTNKSTRKLCPEHERKDISKGAGIRNIQGKQEQMRKFLDELHTFKIDEIDRRLNRLRERQTSLERKIDRVIENMEKLDENFTNMKKLNSKITESMYDRGPEYYDNIQKQILTLNNKIIKIQEGNENDKRNRRTRKDME